MVVGQYSQYVIESQRAVDPETSGLTRERTVCVVPIGNVLHTILVFADRTTEALESLACLGGFLTFLFIPVCSDNP